MPKLRGSSQRISALVRLFEESRGRGVTAATATLTRHKSGANSCDIPPPAAQLLISANQCANMVFNYSDYQQQIVSAGVTGQAASADVTVEGAGNSAEGVAADTIESGGGLDSRSTGTLDMGKGFTNGHAPPEAPPPPPKPPRPVSNGVITNGHRPTLKTKDKPPKVHKKPQKEPVKLFHMNGFSQDGHLAIDDASCTFVGSRNVLEPETLREHKIVSSKGTVRGFTNRVRAGIATFIDQEQLMVRIFIKI